MVYQFSFFRAYARLENRNITGAVSMRITMAQLNPVVGDIEGNVSKILDTLRVASEARAELAVFPELTITGYPPKDLLERPAFIEQAVSALDRVAAASKAHPGLGIILGCPSPTGREKSKALYNSAFLISDGGIRFQQPKLLLPTYDVFDEGRYFAPATENAVTSFNGIDLGLSICEDLWHVPDPWNKRPYPCDPIEMLAEKGASLIINISASPFSVGKEKVRYDLIHDHTKTQRVAFLFVNQTGGNDDLVFDGRSLFVDDSGHARHVLPSFEEAVVTVDTNDPGRDSAYTCEDELETIFKALVLGTRDYLHKCGFSKAVIGGSGGIDSAVTAVVASHALGPENVLVLAMPSPYSSPESMEDAEALARNLGVSIKCIAISEIMTAYEDSLRDAFKGKRRDETEENIQARIRGNLLMAFSNKFGYLPLSTGNKSELAVGYCTLYGDMTGGLSVISDVPKTLVYKLAELINRDSIVIPKRIIEKPPSAELKPDQKDQDTLPPYDVLDRILEAYIDQHQSVGEIVKAGFDRKTVSWVIDAVRKNEYKRKQAAPGLKVTSKAFGTGRRMPIAAKYDA
jgi:NAD+ synthase (glutamine-hydrolysing)